MSWLAYMVPRGPRELRIFGGARRLALVALSAHAVLTACVIDNPAFSGSTASGSSATETTTPTTPTTTTTTPTEATTTPTTTSEESTTSPITGTTTLDSSTTADTEATTTGGPSDCWGLDPDAWEITPIDDATLGQDPRSTRLSADGLRLYYLAEAPGRPYWSERATLDDPFLIGTMFPPWAAPGGAGEVTLLADETEMILSRNDVNNPGNTAIHVSVKRGDSWSIPTLLANLDAPQAPEYWSTVTEDGSRVIFSRQTGPYNPYLMSETRRYFEAQRQANAAPGTDFSAPVEVVLPGITDAPYPHPLYCPSLSPDGLTLFFGSSYPTVLDAGNAKGALQIHMVTREELGAPWSISTPIKSFKRVGWESCPWSITRDGCQMTFQHAIFPQNADIDPNRMLLARRSP